MSDVTLQLRPKIQLVTADKSLAAQLSIALVQMGYALSGIAPSLKEANLSADVQMLMLDCRLGEVTNEVAKLHLPVLCLIKSEENKPEKPFAYLTAPFTKHRLYERIEHLLNNPLNGAIDKGAKIASQPETYKLEDRIFVRHKEKMVKLEIEQILYVEADRNYSRIHSKNKEYMVAVTLKNMASKLPELVFYRIHRSYIVNLLHVDEIAETHLVIAQKALPISKTLKAGLLKRLQTI